MPIDSRPMTLETRRSDGAAVESVSTQQMPVSQSSPSVSSHSSYPPSQVSLRLFLFVLFRLHF